ncbi:hypothetical protein ACE34W_004157 [Vibrio parahaemolyticus]
MMYLKAEVRVCTSKEYENKGEQKVAHNLKLEQENGSDIYLRIPEKLATPDNIEYLKSLKGQNVKVEFWLSHRDKYLTYFMSNLPEII